MNKYKVAVSKWQKKYVFVIDAENENIAKDRVHKEWYTILNVEKILDENILWKKFYFVANHRGQEKKWKVIWKDVFKIFIKLKWLWYNVLELYEESDINASLEKKKQFIKDLEDQYMVFDKSRNKQEKTIKKEVDSLADVNLKEFHLKKQLEDNYRLIDLVLNKLWNILKNKEQYGINSDKEYKLQEIYNNLLKFKKITNISKLKAIWELALLKIWKIELDILEKTKDEKTKNLLKETNKLLKQTWSNKQFIEKNKDIKILFKNFLNKFKKKEKNKNVEKKEVDRVSHSYMKNLLLLSKYKKRLKQNKFWIFKQISLMLINRKEYEINVLKVNVIKQNIAILTARKKGYVPSYTRALKSTKTIINTIEFFFKDINKFLFLILATYIISFILYINLFSKNINYEWMYIFLALFILYILVSISRNLFLLILNFVFFYFIIIFWSINF